MSNDTIRAAITAALRRRGTIDDLDASPSLTLLGSRTSTASVVIYGADGAVVDVVARASDDAKALRGVAFAVGLCVDPCPACNGRGRRAYGREVEDGCDECECSGVVANDPAEEVERLRESVAYVGASCDREITINGVALRAAHLNPSRFDVERLTRERDKATERADSAEFALQCEATRHEATRAAVQEYLAAIDALTAALADDSDAGDAVAMLARMHVVRTRRDEALSRLRALVSS